MDGYSHTQKGFIRPILLAVAVLSLAWAWLARSQPVLPACLIGAAVSIALAFAFGHLTVRDEGDRLGVRFGPIPIFKRMVPYAQITAASRERSTILSGWGIHWTRKGWLWNIGGFNCIRIRTAKESVLIGTNDPEGLLKFIQSKLKTDDLNHAEK